MKNLTEQKMHVLQLVGTFGYLSTKDVAKLKWPTHGERSAHVMAQAVLTKLVALGLVLARDLRQRPGMEVPKVLPAGVPRGYVLTTKGSAVLNERYEPEWVATEHPEGTKPVQWFADGYNLSLADNLARTPVIDLCHALLASGAGWTPVGRRAVARNFMGHADLAHFDAVLLNDAGHVVVAVHLAHPQTDMAGVQIARLAKGPMQFLICCDRRSRLPALQKWRDASRPGMADYIRNILPLGVEA